MSIVPTQSDVRGVIGTTITWQDEFDAPSDSVVDATRWSFETGEPGRANGERQWYTDSASNASHDGAGNLVITARRENATGRQCQHGTCEYTSARLITAGKFTQRYGRFEARMKMPRGQGVWPAVWLLGADMPTQGWPDAGEIDVMENVGKEPQTVYGTVHGPGYSGADGKAGTRRADAPLADAFHTYRVDWTPNRIVWFLDGVEYHRVTPSDLRGRDWVFDRPFYLLVNLAIGGTWPGNPDADTEFPARLLVDYVRVWGYES